jgi:phage shock protein C
MMVRNTPAVIEESFMYCNHCGKPNPDDARLCAYCGASLAGGLPERRLVRPVRDRKIAGVCAGVAQYYGWNVTAIRLIWLLLFLFAGTGGLLYFILWIVIPNEGQ